jgi:putative hydroxymethylpyrimidine transporter CytX
MKENKISVFSSGLIWFGAAISIAEILTGTSIAPLGFAKGLLAIILGHIIGCALFYLAGLIGARTGKSAMETVKISFGSYGVKWFAFLNVLQLLGWTAIMILSGADALNGIFAVGDGAVWSVAIGIFILIWLLIGITNLKYVNIVAMSALFILTIVMSFVVFGGDGTFAGSETISFGAAVELSVAMPLSWLPLISDYTRFAEKGKKATFVSAAVYFFASCWMYVIGMAAALFTGESSISAIMVAAGLGVVGLIVIFLSTVTTTFLDAYSAGVSSVSLNKKLNEKAVAIIVCVVGTLLAVFVPVYEFEDFLYLIGSVFAPMIAIMIADFFVLKNDFSKQLFAKANLILWVIGFILYRCFMYIDTPVGNTLPVMLIVIVLSVVVNKILGGKQNA